MRRPRNAVTLAVLLSLVVSGVAIADTAAPSSQTFVLDCDGTELTFVSPIEAARAAQLADGTGVGVLQRLSVDGGPVLFEAPSYAALSARGHLTTCMADGLTFEILVTPRGGRAT